MCVRRRVSCVCVCVAEEVYRWWRGGVSDKCARSKAARRAPKRAVSVRHRGAHDVIVVWLLASAGDADAISGLARRHAHRPLRPRQHHKSRQHGRHQREHSHPEVWRKVSGILTIMRDARAPRSGGAAAAAGAVGGGA